MKQSFNMEQTIMATENLKGTMATVDAMRSANAVLKTQYKHINVSKIEDIQDEMEDLLEQGNEINEIMGRSYGVPDDIDEDDLQAGMIENLEDLIIELDALGDEMFEDESEPAYLSEPASKHPELPSSETAPYVPMMIPTKLNIASWSVSPETTFTCPAKFTLNAAVGTENASGSVYAVIQTSDAWSKQDAPKNAGKKLCSWTFGDKTPQQIVSHNVPVVVKLFAKQVTSLLVVGGRIGVVFGSGLISVMSGFEFEEVKGSKMQSRVLAVQCFESAKGCTLFRLSTIDNKHEVQEVKLKAATDGSILIDITLRKEVSLAAFAGFTQVQFNPYSRALVFKHKKAMYSINLDKKSQTSKLTVDTNTLALLSLECDHFVTASKKDAVTLITLHEISYGTQRHEITLPFQFDSVTFSELSTADMGVCLLVSGTSIQPSKFETQIFIIPFHVEKTSLLESLGKARSEHQVANCTLNILNIEDVEQNLTTKTDLQQASDLEFIAAFKLLKTEPECTALYIKWAAKKTLLRVNQEFLSLILTHLIDTKLYSFKIISAIIKTKATLPASLITFLAGVAALDTIKLALFHSELSERDLVICLKYSLALEVVDYSIVDSVFQNTSNHNSLVSHLKSLTIEHVSTLLQYAKSTFELDTANAANIVSLLVDAHLPMMILSKPLHAILTDLQELIEEESQVDYHVAFDFPVISVEKDAKEGKKRYNTLVKDASNVQGYSVDVISI